MPFRVFFVEDEIVTREGIRDNVDWQGHGFELCGEAPDGEIALPMLQAAKPDVLITDIKMPFMDGLQLSKIVRERLPRTKVVILSGHDEFEYAQQAIKLGVTEYLLKPVTAQHLHQVLQRLAQQLEHERKEQLDLDRLRQQVDEHRSALVERLWFKLLVGAISLADAIDQGELLSLDLLARCYLVVVIRIARHDGVDHTPHSDYQLIQDIVTALAGADPDVSVLRKDVEELVLIIKGNTPEYLLEARDVLLDQIRSRVSATPWQLKIGTGSPCHRLTDVGQSFLEALAMVEDITHDPRGESIAGTDLADWLKADKSALEDCLKCGIHEEIDEFFNSFILPLGNACRSSIVRNYLMLDIAFTAARLINEWGGDPEEVLPELQQLEPILSEIATIDDIREHAQPLLHRTLAFRDSQASGPHSGVIHQAREYIEQHFMDPRLSLHVVASQVNHSPSHFCTVFGEATGRTFKAYLTDVRMKRAKELLRSTGLRPSEIAAQVGYNDPHYFSLVFRKAAGMSPKDYRLQAQRTPAAV